MYAHPAAVTLNRPQALKTAQSANTSFNEYDQSAEPSSLQLFEPLEVLVTFKEESFVLMLADEAFLDDFKVLVMSTQRGSLYYHDPTYSLM